MRVSRPNVRCRTQQRMLEIPPEFLVEAWPFLLFLSTCSRCSCQIRDPPPPPRRKPPSIRGAAPSCLCVQDAACKGTDSGRLAASGGRIIMGTLLILWGKGCRGVPAMLNGNFDGARHTASLSISGPGLSVWGVGGCKYWDPVGWLIFRLYQPRHAYQTLNVATMECHPRRVLTTADDILALGSRRLLLRERLLLWERGSFWRICYDRLV